MKPARTAFIFVTCLSVLLPDAGHLQRKNLQASVGNFAEEMTEWNVVGEVLTPVPDSYHREIMLMVKPEVIRAPKWYSVGCTMVAFSDQKTPTMSGLVVGYRNDHDYWLMLIGQQAGEYTLYLLHSTNAGKHLKSDRDIAIPLRMPINPSRIVLSAEVFGGSYFKIYVAGELAGTYKSSSLFSEGQIGLYSSRGSIGFSGFGISEIAKY